MNDNRLSPKCSNCGSPLVFISKETIKPEGSFFMQTNNIYRCSNEECQNMKDAEKEKRILTRQKKELSDKARLESSKKKVTATE